MKINVESNRQEYINGFLKDGVCLSDCWSDIPHNAKEKVNRPTQKLLKLMERIISMVTNPDDVILDFCMGSGSTGVACIKLGRRFIGVENNKQYFDLAVKRITLLNGENDVL